MRIRPSTAILEFQQSSLGKIEALDANARSFAARTIENDAYMAEALALTEGSIEPLERARAFLMRGSCSEASSILHNLPYKNDEELGEILLEKARLFSFEGEWQKSLECADHAYSLKLNSLTHFTVLQVRSVVLFELGYLTEALAALAPIYSLAKMFPFADHEIFADSLKVKILSRLGLHEKAGHLISDIWERWLRKGNFNSVQLLSLLRAMADVAIGKGGCPTSLLYATYLIAKASGLGLYEGMAVLQLHLSSIAGQKQAWSDEISTAVQKFSRIRKLISELNSAADDQVSTSISISTSARVLIQLKANRESLGSAQCQTSGLHREPSHLIFVDGSLLVSLSPLTFAVQKFPSQIKRALALLAEGPVARGDFFSCMNDGQKYFRDTHDGVVRTLCHRIRKVTGLEVESVNNHLQLKKSIVVKFA